jgi:hypothetical protein
LLVPLNAIPNEPEALIGVPITEAEFPFPELSVHCGEFTTKVAQLFHITKLSPTTGGLVVVEVDVDVGAAVVEVEVDVVVLVGAAVVVLVLVDVLVDVVDVLVLVVDVEVDVGGNVVVVVVANTFLHILHPSVLLSPGLPKKY